MTHCRTGVIIQYWPRDEKARDGMVALLRGDWSELVSVVEKNAEGADDWVQLADVFVVQLADTPSALRCLNHALAIPGGFGPLSQGLVDGLRHSVRSSALAPEVAAVFEEFGRRSTNENERTQLMSNSAELWSASSERTRAYEINNTLFEERLRMRRCSPGWWTMPNGMSNGKT